MIFIPLLFIVCLVSRLSASIVYPYTTASEEVGKLLETFDPLTDHRYAWEVGVGKYLQGDILLRPSDFKNRNGVPLNETKRWTNKTVPYVIDPTITLSQTELIMSAMKQFTKNSCVKFVKRTTEQYYLIIENKKVGCTSTLGMSTSPGMNRINYDTGCFDRIGTIVHEIMHTLGFNHEHVRPDRDQYLIINKNAMSYYFAQEPFYSQNVGIYNQGLTFGIPYDYESVMHYSKDILTAYEKLPAHSLDNKQPWTGDFGNPKGLSPLDIKKVNAMYSC